MDFDFSPDPTSETFQVTLGDNASSVSGNRALLNRFEITFLTKRRQFVLGTTAVIDNYGGEAIKLVGQPRVLSDLQSISTSLSIVTEQTVQDMIAEDQKSNKLINTERIVSASVIGLDIVDDLVSAKIQVFPVEVESYDALIFNFPIING